MFVSERGAPFSTEGFARLLQRAAKVAGITIKAHPHMLRHACGYKLANDGVDTRALQSYLGHKNIQHTVRYTEMAPGPLQGILDRLRIRRLRRFGREAGRDEAERQGHARLLGR